MEVESSSAVEVRLRGRVSPNGGEIRRVADQDAAAVTNALADPLSPALDLAGVLHIVDRDQTLEERPVPDDAAAGGAGAADAAG